MDFAVLNCPICLEPYSTTKYPIISPQCSHSICKPCGNQLRSNECTTCRQKAFRTEGNSKKPWLSDEWGKNFLALDLLGIPYATGPSLMNCFGCKINENIERMKICETCGDREWDRRWREDSEEKLFSFVFCGLCCIDKHKNHKLSNLTDWKIQTLSSDVAKAQKSAFDDGMELLRQFEVMREYLPIWKEEMDKCIRLEFKTFEEKRAMMEKLEKTSNDFKASTNPVSDDRGDSMETVVAVKTSNAILRTSVYWMKKWLREYDEKNCVMIVKENPTAHVQRFPLTTQSSSRFGHENTTNDTVISVSHNVLLSAVSVYCTKDNSEEVGGSIDIRDVETRETVYSFDFSLGPSATMDKTRKVCLEEPFLMLSGISYMLTYEIPSDTTVYSGYRKEVQKTFAIELPNIPNCFMTLEDCSVYSVHSSTEREGDIGGFYFTT